MESDGKVVFDAGLLGLEESRSLFRDRGLDVSVDAGPPVDGALAFPSMDSTTADVGTGHGSRKYYSGDVSESDVINEGGREYVVHNGEKIPLVRRRFARLRRTGPRQEERRDEIRSRIYVAIADLLPREGRDYDVEVSFDGDSDAPSVRLVPRTVFGGRWCEHLASELKGAMDRAGWSQQGAVSYVEHGFDEAAGGR